MVSVDLIVADPFSPTGNFISEIHAAIAELISNLFNCSLQYRFRELILLKGMQVLTKNAVDKRRVLCLREVLTKGVFSPAQSVDYYAV